MCQILQKAPREQVQSPSAAVPAPMVEELLREAAFVLQMTSRIKDSIRNERPIAASAPRE